MAKIKRGRYLPTTRQLKVLQNEIASVNTRLKGLIDKFQKLELDSLANKFPF
jgi:hypothetical protein